MAKRTSKSIAERIDVDYYRRPHPLRDWKRKASWGAFFVTLIGMLVITFGLGDHRMYQAGPVSDYHKIIAHDCERCHSQTWQTGMRLVTMNEAHRTVPDATCVECHAGPEHNEKEIKSAVQRCAECHREHRGNTSLASVTNAECIRCHGNLQTEDGSHTYERSITAFANHPEFRQIKDKTKDPGTIRFNHAAHLAKPMKKPYIPGEEAPDTQTVSLQCVDCHQADSNRQYMLPVKFDQHCSSCHSSALTFDSKLFPKSPVPHGNQLDVVRGVLREKYAEYVTTHREEVLGTPTPAETGRQMPWHSLPVELDEQEHTWVNERVARANDRILNRNAGCAYCHDIDKNAEGIATAVVSAKIPDRWFTHSVFRHDAHRMLNCEGCHVGVPESKLTADVLMPGIDSCKKCHGPTSLASGSARDDCVECHIYHNHKQNENMNGPYPLDPTQWKSLPPSTPQAKVDPTLGTVDVLDWLRNN